MRILIRILLILFIGAFTSHAQAAVSIKGCLNFNGVLEFDTISSDFEDITPKKTLGVILSNIGGLTDKSDFRNVKVIQDNMCYHLDLTYNDALNFKLNNDATVLVSELSQSNITEEEYKYLSNHNLYQGCIYIKNFKDNTSEVLLLKPEVTELLSRASSNMPNYFDIRIKRSKKGKTRTIKYKPEKHIIKDNDILIIR